MIEKLIQIGLVGFVSAGLGTYVSQKLLAKDVESIRAAQKELIPLKGSMIEAIKDIEAIKALGEVHDTRLSDHDKKFERSVWRDECGKNQTICSKHNDERWEEMKDRMKDLKDAFNSCFDNLVSELKKDGN